MHQPLFAIFKIIEKNKYITEQRIQKSNFPIGTINYDLNNNLVKNLILIKMI